jgi:uncharacterized RDD family membrane protein YckC
MTSRFELGHSEEPAIPIVVHAPENSDAAHFVIEPPDPSDARVREESPDAAAELSPAPEQPNLLAPEPDLSWRSEVADRVNRYRARRRPHQPRYPSLTLKFDPPEPRPAPRLEHEPLPPTHHALAIEPSPPEAAAAETGKLLEFPRPLTLPALPLDELAEPVVDRPRILEVPEVAPPPPALGGILIEPVEEKPEEKRPGFEIPLQSAPLSRRMTAVAIDAILVLAACVLFGYTFFRVTRQIPPLQPALAMAAVVAGIFWAGYQFLALIFTATTPGLRLARLELHRFDGSPVPRNLRRWRVLASMLSGVSLGLGYAWCFLDEDQLCWHDRITRTYMAPKR